MKYKELQTHIETLKPYLKDMEARLLKSHRIPDPVARIGLRRSEFKFHNRRKKLNFENIVSRLIHFTKNISPFYLAYLCITVSMNLSWNDLRLPSTEEMRILLDAAGLKGDDLVAFHRDNLLPQPYSYPVPEKASIVIFIAKILFDAIEERNTDVLVEVNDKMIEMGIIGDYSRKASFWHEFAVMGIDHYVEQEMFIAVQREFQAMLDDYKELFDSVGQYIEEECLEYIRQKAGTLVNTHFEDGEWSEEIREHRRLYEEVSAEYSSVMDDIFSSVEEYSLKLNAMKSDLFDGVDPVAIAEGFYASIMQGDELLFLPVVQSLLSHYFIALSFPGIPYDIKPLDDEDSWNDGDMSSNGRRASVVYEKDDLITPEMEFNYEGEDHVVEDTIPVRTFLAELSGVAMPDSIYVRHSIVRRLREYGISERKARDMAVVVAAYRAKYQDRDELLDLRVLENIYPEESVDKGSSVDVEKEIDSLNERIADLEGRLKSYEKENKSYRHQITGLEKKIEELNEKHEIEIEELLSETQVEDDSDNQRVGDIEYPYHTDKKITLYGGFDAFHRELSKLLPDVKIVEPCYKTPNLDVFRNSDMVFIQPNKLNHGNYFSVRDAAKHADVPYYHLRFACARKCADFMVEEIERL